MADLLPVTVTVILPTRNEEEAIVPTVESIESGLCKDLEIMIVDVNSTDKTRELALKKGIRVHLEDRKGYGRAYRTGFDVAKNDIMSMFQHCLVLTGTAYLRSSEGPSWARSLDMLTFLKTWLR